VVLRYLLDELKPSDPLAEAVRDFLRNSGELPGTIGSVSWTD
jgi:hypothetical protein